MQALRFLALAGALATVIAPAALVVSPTAAIAQSTSKPTKQQLETAVKAAHPTIGQLRQLKQLEPNINSMTPAQVQQSLHQIFSAQQLAAISQSLKAQGVSMPAH